MHPIIRNRCSQEVLLHIKVGYEDGDVILAPALGCLAKVFYHESRKIDLNGEVRTYNISVHINYVEELPDDYRVIHYVSIAGVQYLVKGVSEIRNPLTQKITTLVLKI